MILVSLNVGTVCIYGEFRETLVKGGLWKKNRLHYGNKAIIYVFNFLNFHMWFWGNNMVLRRFLKKKLKIVSRGISVFGGKSMEKLDGCISHCWW